MYRSKAFRDICHASVCDSVHLCVCLSVCLSALELENEWSQTWYRELPWDIVQLVQFLGSKGQSSWLQDRKVQKGDQVAGMSYALSLSAQPLVKYMCLMQEIVLMLLQHGADVRLINSEGNSAYNVAKATDIKSMIEGYYSSVFIYSASAPSSWFFCAVHFIA